MIKIILVMPKLPHGARTDFHPIGLAYIASYIKKNIKNCRIKIIDFGVENFNKKKWINTLNKFKPHFVGISLSTLHYPHAIKITKVIKKISPKTKVIWGGPHVDTKSEDCLKYCDYVVIGEGEVTFYELIKNLNEGKSIKNIKGVYYKKNKKIINNPSRERINNLDEHPWPAYDLVDLKKYFEYPLAGIMGNRGCPFNCSFCDSPLRWKYIVKKRSAKNILDEIEFLHKTFGIKGIYFFDDILNLPEKRALDICDQIIKRGINKKIYFQAQLRANKPLVSEKLFRKLKKANFNKISFGVESGSQKVLNSMNKNVTVEELERAVKLGLKSGIDTRAFFMIGNWDEGFIDILKTIKFMLKTGVNPSITIATPFPGTEFYNRLKAEGYIKKIDWSKATTTKALNRTNKMSKMSIDIIYKIIYSFFYFKKIFDLPTERKIDFLKKKVNRFNKNFLKKRFPL